MIYLSNILIFNSKLFFFQCGPQDFSLPLTRPLIHFEFETPALECHVLLECPLVKDVCILYTMTTCLSVTSFESIGPQVAICLCLSIIANLLFNGLLVASFSKHARTKFRFFATFPFVISFIKSELKSEQLDLYKVIHFKTKNFLNQRKAASTFQQNVLAALWMIFDVSTFLCAILFWIKLNFELQSLLIYLFEVIY